MLIICPTCSSSYLIRAKDIGAEGRLVRCGSCQNSWQVDGVASGTNIVPPESKQDIEFIDENPDTPAPPQVRSSDFSRRKLAIGSLALAALVTSFVMPLGRIVDVARSLIHRVLPVDRFAGLDFENVSSQLVAENDDIFLVVEGKIINRIGENRVVPALALTIRGEDQNQIFRWTAKPPAETISAGSPIPFKVRLASPPITGREVSIRFVDASEVEDASAS